MNNISITLDLDISQYIIKISMNSFDYSDIKILIALIISNILNDDRPLFLQPYFSKQIK